jgi:hypothetical protein
MSGPDILLTIAVAVLLVGGVALPVGIVALVRARAVPRVQVPARVVSRFTVLAGDVITVEYPGPDGTPLRRDVFAASRRGLGATPTFHGYAYVNPDDPTDVKTRPQGKVGPGWTLIIVGSVALVAGIALLLVALAGVYLDSVDLT